jgi:hypothetical protein
MKTEILTNFFKGISKAVNKMNSSFLLPITFTLVCFASCTDTDRQTHNVNKEHDVSNSSQDSSVNTKDIGRDSTDIGHPTDSGTPRGKDHH